jgi:hypothetical protein
VSVASPARGLLAFLLGLVAVVLLPAALTAHWADHLVGSTSAYVATVQPLSHDRAVQKVAADRIDHAVLSNIPPALNTALGPKARSAVGTLSQAAVQSEAFPVAWKAANSTAHQRLLEALQSPTPPQHDVTIPLSAVVNAVTQKLVPQGSGLHLTVPEDAAAVTLLPKSEVPRARTAYQRLTEANTWLPWATGGAAVLCLLVAVRRFKALAWLAGGGALTSLLVPVGLVVARQTVVAHATGTAPRPARQAVWDAFVAGLRHEATYVAAVLALVAVVAAVLAVVLRRSR